jgi:ribose/xylose/arabinose/galactoside ABC-type transport system permease subunit
MPNGERSSSSATLSRLARRILGTGTFRLLLALALLSAVFSLAYPSTFATRGNLENMTRVGGILLVVAVGQMFALLIGGFDLSVAANMGFVSVVTALVMTDHGGLAPGIVVGVLAGTAIGLVNGLLISGVGLSPFIVTLGMLTFLGGLGNELAHGAPIFGFPSNYNYIAARDWGPIPAPLGVGALILVVTWFLAARARAGLYIYAIGGNRETCRAAGVPVVRYEVLAYTLCGALAGIAGMMELSRVSIGYVTNGQGYELLSIAAAVIGGTAIGGGVGNLSGVVLGVAFLTVLSTGLDIARLSDFYQRMVFGAVIVGSVLVSQLRSPGARRRLERVFLFRRRRLKALAA